MARDELRCAGCGVTDDDLPLIETRYKGDVLRICCRCVPTLIHRTHDILGRLPEGAAAGGAPDD